MKKTIATVLVLMFLFTLFPVNAFASSEDLLNNGEIINSVNELNIAMTEETVREDDSTSILTVYENADNGEKLTIEDFQDCLLLSGINQIEMGDYGFNETESNDYFNQADIVYNDCTVYGSLSSNDVDYYTFNLTERSMVKVACIADKQSFYMAIWDRSYELFAASEDLGYTNNGQFGDGISVTLDPGTYYIISSFDENITYTFYIEITPHAHNYTTSVITEPTCVNEGYTTYTCECGDSYVDDYVNSTGVHTYQNDSDAICDVCGFVRELKAESISKDISLARLEEFSDVITISDDNKQAPMVILNDEYLTLNTDYVVWYYNTDSIGTAKMLIIGIGDYTGYIEKEYEITGPYNLKIGEDAVTSRSVPIKLNIGNSFDGVELYYDGKKLLEYDTEEEAKDFFSKSMTYGPWGNDADGKANWGITRYIIETEGGYKWNGYAYVWTETTTKKTLTSHITTVDSPVTKLVWAETEPIMQKNKIFVQPSIYPAYSYDQELTWSSSDETVATVDDFGVVTIVAPGTCVITAATSNGLSVTQELSINAMNISKVGTVECNKNTMGDYNFTVRDKYGVLEKGVDYEISYQIKDNIIYATFEGLGLYDGTLRKYFDIANNLNELSSEELHYAIGGSGEHIWQLANCTSPKTCTICYETAGEALGHDWQAATCTDFGTCSRCMISSGKTIGHIYSDSVDGTCNRCGIYRNDTEKRTVMDMFRMYDPNSGEHFYTGSEVERDNLIKAGWNYEGVGFTFSRTTGAPVYRLYDSVYGEHLYTMDIAERDKLILEGWNLEGIAFNSAYDTEVPQYRLHNPNATRGAYHFTASTEERNQLISLGWEDQGIGWYSIGVMVK